MLHCVVMDDNGRNSSSTKFSRLTKLAILFAIVAVLGFMGGLSIGSNERIGLSDLPLLGSGLDATPDPRADLGDFWKAWNVLSTRFVETHASSTLPNSTERVWGAIEGMVQSFGDPYTVFMRPEDAKIFAEDISGNFSGVGMEIGVKDDVLTVIAPLKNTPAERAGIMSGDHIVGIDGESTKGLSTDVAVKKIRGEQGTPVVFQILRAGEAKEITVVRDVIQVPTIEYALDNSSGVYTISLFSFTANSGSLFSKALADFRASGSHRLLIDLRGNPGGYLASAVSISSHFLPKGEVIVTEDYDGNKENVVHRSKGLGGVPEGTKVVILINEGSASASEIVAGALQDSGVATLIGQHSFGKGSVQELVKIGDGSLKVTVAKWLTPSGRSISDGGLAVDVEVERTQEDFLAGLDPQKERAIEYLVNGQ